jgi:hypothetical protein
VGEPQEPWRGLRAVVREGVVTAREYIEGQLAAQRALGYADPPRLVIELAVAQVERVLRGR